MKRILVFVFAVSLFVGCGPEYGEMTDQRDGKTYKTIQIGNQMWMAENLATEPSIKLNILKRSCRIYNNNAENITKYGILYDWKKACEVCPEGWHLPSYEEWMTMFDELGRDEFLSKKLKGTSGWKGSMNGTNESGFNALPGGTYINNSLSKKENIYYYWVGEYTSFHTSTDTSYSNGEKFVYMFEIEGFDFVGNKIDRDNISLKPLPSDNSRNFSYVRCIKD